MHRLNKFKEELKFAHSLSDDIMQVIFQERWLQIWVPKEYHGLGLNFSQGLKILKNLAKTNASLGWMITLCAGANYFSRNLKPEIATVLFKDYYTCFGGSGMIGGTAIKTPNGYLINGTWKYATGAPHLSHFTLNALVINNGSPVLNDDGSELVKSFIVPKNQVEIITDWKSMGMKATGTYSFKVANVLVTEPYSFFYNEFFTDSALDKIPFRIFADLTLLVNYLGMAEHFLDEALKTKPQLNVSIFKKQLQINENQIWFFADKIERILQNKEGISDEIEFEIHQFGTKVTTTLAHELLNLYMQLGIVASHEKHPINLIFNDFFTATQHANFRP